jgi:hypothetical protein
MSDNQLFGEENSPTRVLWRAILRYDDDEVAENLFSLVSHQRMSQAEEAIVAEILQSRRGNDHWRASNLIGPFESFLNAFLSEAFTLTEMANAGTAEIASRAQASVAQRACRTWRECQAAHSRLVQALREWQSRGEFKRIPPGFQIAWAISQTLDSVTSGESQLDARSTQPTQSATVTQADWRAFFELRQMYPLRVEMNDIPKWVELIVASDWRTRFTARVVLQSVGVAALMALYPANSHAKLNLWRSILGENAFQGYSDQLWYCLHCRSRFKRYEFQNLVSLDSHYYACRSCANTRSALRIKQVVCVLDRAFANNPQGFIATESGHGKMMVESGSLMHSTIVAYSGNAGKMPVFPMLFEPWSSTRRPFDFDLLYIGDVDDKEIEQLLAALLSDNDTERKRCMSAITAVVAQPERLSTNSKNALSRLFHQVVYSPSNWPEMATIAAFIEQKRKGHYAGHARQTA